MPACPAWRRRRVGTTRSWCAASRRWRCAMRRAPPRPVSCSLRPVGRAQRAPLERLTGATGLFRPEDVGLAVELLDKSLAGDDDYRFLGAYADDDLVGYACWGPTPGTQGTYNLYWIVVEPTWQGKGIGTQLLDAVEKALTADGCRLLVVETSSRADYAPTRTFSDRRRYAQAARLPGYYAPADDLVIYLKDLVDGVLARTTA